ncbi:hypothetical protein CNY89_14795 [Amaricoccus sp. HAR-UPW-R2A-40]|nr:hypothetical protein CNY89_14795 [Amaricoccus sp. HAR-UPW-R2A-40]
MGSHDARFADAERSFDGFLAALRQKLAAYQTYRRTLGELRALDARSRADIGMDDLAPEVFARAAVYGTH